MRALLALAIAAVWLTATSGARAQGSQAEARIDTMQTASADSEFTRAEGTWKEFDEGIAYAFRLDTEYLLSPMTSVVEGGASPEDDEVRLVAHALLGHIGASLSPFYWMNLELRFTFAPFETGDPDDRVPQQRFEAGKPGVGDTRVGAHFRPYTSPELGVSIGARWWGPTGSDAAYLAGRNKFSRFELTPAIAGEVDLLLYGCTLGIAPLWFAGRDGDRLAASCGAHFKLAPMFTLGLEPHLALFSYGAPASQQRRPEHTPGLGKADLVVQFEPTAVVAFRFGDFSVAVSGSPGIGDAPGMAKARAMLTLGWASRGERVVEDVVSDRDLDGVADEYDACPDAAGPKTRRGCPDERDTDGDGIVEGDACPDQAGASYEDPEANGCPDRDNDHLADPVDPCPDEPGVDTGGCPQYARLDADGDSFVIDPPILFSRGGHKLGPTANAALLEIIATMRANPTIEQISVSVGTKRTTQRITDKRAEVLLQIFSEQNLDTSRFEVVLDEELDGGKVNVRVIR